MSDLRAPDEIELSKEEMRRVILGPVKTATELHDIGLMDDQTLLVVCRTALSALLENGIEPEDRTQLHALFERLLSEAEISGPIH